MLRAASAEASAAVPEVTQISCALCRTHVNPLKIDTVCCECPHYAPCCHRCKSIRGQDNSPLPGVCTYCFRRYFNRPNVTASRCSHTCRLTCCHCQTTPKTILNGGSMDLSCMSVAWERLRRKGRILRLSPFLANLASDWGNFSRFYHSFFIISSDWTSERKFAFFQLWFLSQMNRSMIPWNIPIIRVNLMSVPLVISRRLGRRVIQQTSWARKLVCKNFVFAYDDSLFKQSYLQRGDDFPNRMMHQIIMRLLACHSAICEHLI